MSERQAVGQEQSVEVSEPLGSVVASTDDRPIYEAWRKGIASETLAYTATRKVREMAGINVITALGARIEAQGTELRARIEDQQVALAAQTASLRWMIRILIVVFVSILALLAQSLLRPPVSQPLPRLRHLRPPNRHLSIVSPRKVGKGVTEEAPPAAP